MSDQLRLVDVAPNLTPRQQRAYDAIKGAGWDGLRSDELGAIMHSEHHGLHETCSWCVSTGQELGDALRQRGLAQQRRRRTPQDVTYTVWAVAGDLKKPVERDYQLPEAF